MISRVFCKRCKRVFPTDQAIAQHLANSSYHHQCPVCAFDGVSWDDLLTHHHSTKHGALCQGCDDGDGTIWDPRSEEYLQHLVEDNVCQVCHGHFDSPSNLEHHKVTHADRNIECYGCYRKFKTFPHMILHLETGTCESDITSQDLNMTATQCYQAHNYTDEDYREEMLDGEDLEASYEDAVFPFRCPECEGEFARLSGLLQHAASRTCEQTLRSGAIGKLVRWLNKQYE